MSKRCDTFVRSRPPGIGAKHADIAADQGPHVCNSTRRRAGMCSGEGKTQNGLGVLAKLDMQCRRVLLMPLRNAFL